MKITDKMADSLADVTENFEYLSDTKQFQARDAWYIMKEAPYIGDCEDYALTVLYNICNRKIFVMALSLLIGRSKICFTISPSGGGHAVLRHRGLYTDNWQKEWLTKQDYIDKNYAFHKPWFWGNTTLVKVYQGYKISQRKEKEG